MAVSYTELVDNFTVGASGWQDYDIFTNKGIAKAAVVGILAVNTDGSNEQDLGLRTDGSVIVRKDSVHESEGGGVNGFYSLTTVHAATGLIETYCDDETEAIFYIFAYWQGVAFTERFDKWEVAPAGSWNDEDISVYGVPAYAVCLVAMIQTEANWYCDMGVRENGSVINRLERVHECEPTNGDNSIYCNFVKADAESVIEGYVQYGTIDRYHALLGWFGSEIDFVEAWTVKDHDEGGDWDEVDLTGDLDQDGRVVSFVLFNNNVASVNNMGLRGGNSALERRIEEHMSQGYGETGELFTARSDSRGVVDTYADTTETFYFAGYFIFDEEPTPTEEVVVPWHRVKGKGGEARSHTVFRRNLQDRVGG